MASKYTSVLPDPVTPVSSVTPKARRATAVAQRRRGRGLLGAQRRAGAVGVGRREARRARQQRGFDQPGIGHAAQHGGGDPGRLARARRPRAPRRRPAPPARARAAA